MSKPHRIDVNEVKSRADGRWEAIMSRLAPNLAQAIERRGKHVPCPIHGGTDGFRLMKRFDEVGSGVCNTCGVFKDGFSLLMFARQYSFRDALEDVAREVGLCGESKDHIPLPKPKPRPVVNTKQEDEAIRRRLRWVYESTIPIRSPNAEPARLYLRNRGLTLVPAMLRMHPGLHYRDLEGNRLGPFPTLISPIVDAQGRGICLHRVYLTPDGKKAPVGEPKKLMSHPNDVPMQGSAVRLFRYTDTLAVAEGIETAIAVTEATRIPCWALITSTLMPEFVPPSDVKRVLVFGDKDRPTKIYPKGAGQEKAQELVKRLWALGVKASLALPPSDIPEGAKSVDWLDEFNKAGTEPFRRVVNQ